jgi:hypothetical protein
MLNIQLLTAPLYAQQTLQLGKGTITSFDHKDIPDHINNLSCSSYYNKSRMESLGGYEDLSQDGQFWETLALMGTAIVGSVMPLMCTQMYKGKPPVIDPYPMFLAGVSAVISLATISRGYAQEAQANMATVRSLASQAESLSTVEGQNMDPIVGQYQTNWEMLSQTVDKANQMVTTYSILTGALAGAMAVTLFEIVCALLPKNICGIYDGTSQLRCGAIPALQNIKLSQLPQATQAIDSIIQGVGSSGAGASNPDGQANLNLQSPDLKHSQAVCRADEIEPITLPNLDELKGATEDQRFIGLLFKVLRNTILADAHALGPFGAAGRETSNLESIDSDFDRANRLATESSDQSFQNAIQQSKANAMTATDNLHDTVKGPFKNVYTRAALYGALLAITATRLSKAKRERDKVVKNMQRFGCQYCDLVNSAAVGDSTIVFNGNTPPPPNVCMVMQSNGSYELDPSCNCQSTNSCATFQIGNMSGFPSHYQSDWKAFARLATNAAHGRSTAGSSNYWSQKTNKYKQEADKALDKINSIRKSQGKKAIPFYDKVNQYKNQLAALATGQKEKAETVPDLKKDKDVSKAVVLASAPVAKPNSKSSSNRSNDFDIWGSGDDEELEEDLQGREAAALNTEYDLKGHDIGSAGHSIFKQISLRYQQSIHRLE